MPEFETDDGVRLRYTDVGDGPPVVLVAGFRAPATSWVYQQQHLAEQGFRVLSLDRRSHGLSQDPPHGHRMARHGKDLQELLATTGLDQTGEAVLVGASMGASAIWAYVGLFGSRRVRGVVSIDQTVKMCNENGWEHGFYGYTPDVLGTFFAAGPPRDTGYGTPLQDRGERLTRVLAALELGPEDLVPKPLPATALTLLRDHAVQDWRDVVARLEVPALFIGARDSELWPCEHATAAAALNGRASAFIVEDCGHVANLERPDEVNRALTRFLLQGS